MSSRAPSSAGRASPLVRTRPSKLETCSRIPHAAAARVDRPCLSADAPRMESISSVTIRAPQSLPRRRGLLGVELETMFREHQHGVYAYFVRVVGNSHDAEELTQ